MQGVDIELVIQFGYFCVDGLGGVFDNVVVVGFQYCVVGYLVYGCVEFLCDFGLVVGVSDYVIM